MVENIGFAVLFVIKKYNIIDFKILYYIIKSMIILTISNNVCKNVYSEKNVLLQIRIKILVKIYKTISAHIQTE